jgi:hypothetical protein
MPQTRSTAHSSAARPGLPQVPVGIFLPARQIPATAPPQPSTGPVVPPGAGRGDWCDVPARELARLIASYTRPGDLVADLDDHPTVSRAAGYLGRHYRRLHTGSGHEAGGSGRTRCHDACPQAALMPVRLPRADVDSLDLNDLTRAMHTWRTLLRPGGYLLVALAAPGSPDSRVSQRATVITAARTVGLAWQQEFLVVTAALAEYEPRAMPDTAATTPAALVNGRHQPAHVKLLAFQHRIGGDDA